MMIQFPSSAVEKLENGIISEDHKAQKRQARTSQNNEMSLTQRNLQLISQTILLGFAAREKTPKGNWWHSFPEAPFKIQADETMETTGIRV